MLLAYHPDHTHEKGTAMATTIKNTETGEILDLECIVDGVDILADVIGGSGFDADDEGWLMDSHDVSWWARWAEREERITAAYEDATDEAKAACQKAVDEWSHDWVAMQDAEEVALGLAGYVVMVAPSAENCDEVRIEEHFLTEDQARERFEEIAHEDGWGDGLEVSLFEVLEPGIMDSIDSESL